MSSIRQAIEEFISSDQFESAVDSATKAGFGGSGYSVELFDGTFRVLWDGEIGNLYVSPGVIVGIPQYDAETISDGPDCDLTFALEEARASIRESFEARAHSPSAMWTEEGR